MIDLTKEIWQTMRTNKLRTLLTGFSVAWGIFMLILLLAVAKGLINRSVSFMAENDPNRLQIWSGITSMPYQGLEKGRQIDFGNRDFEPLKRANTQYVREVTASLPIIGQISTTKDYINETAEGVYPEKFTERYKLQCGRFINEADIKHQRKVMVLPKGAAESLFSNPQEAIGKYVKLGNIAFTIVGVYDLEWDRSPYIPYSTAFALKGYPVNGISQLNVHLKNIDSPEQAQEVESEVVKTLAKVERFSPDDQSAVWVNNRFVNYIEQLKATGYLNYAMWTIGLLTLITGIVGVSNIMFVSVRERTHEIGIRRAIGAKPRNILTQIVLESIALTTCFGYIGIVMGTLAVEGVKVALASAEFIKDPGIDISIAIEVTIALIIAGALAGIFPAMRALKIKPVEALMEE